LLEAPVLLADQVPSPAIDARLVNRLTESNARLLQRRRPGAQDWRSQRTAYDGANVAAWDAIFPLTDERALA